MSNGVFRRTVSIDHPAHSRSHALDRLLLWTTYCRWFEYLLSACRHMYRYRATRSHEGLVSRYPFADQEVPGMPCERAGPLCCGRCTTPSLRCGQRWGNTTTPGSLLLFIL